MKNTHHKSIQVSCPKDGRQQVVDVEITPEGIPAVNWCSQGLEKPSCTQECLKRLKNVSFMMITNVPTFDLKELRRMSCDQVLERFQDTEFDRLPVLDSGLLVGSLALRDVAFWKDNRQIQVQLNMEEWAVEDDDPQTFCWVKDASCSLRLSDHWTDAIATLLHHHQNEVFVVDEDDMFVGLVYARQLLRRASS